MSAHPDLELALRVSDRAAVVALGHFEAGVAMTSKSDGSPVTEADRVVELVLRRAISEERATDGFLGEEFGRVGDSERVWIIDPIDGTRFFGRRDPNWRIHVALEVSGVTELAVVTAPALGVRWWATHGAGAFESTWPSAAGLARHLAVTTTSSSDDATVEALSKPRTGTTPARFGPPSSPLPLVELVRGEIDGVLAEGYYSWDHAPWILLVQEAGGLFTDPTGGHASDRGGGLYSNAALHHELLQALQYPRG